MPYQLLMLGDFIFHLFGIILGRASGAAAGIMITEAVSVSFGSGHFSMLTIWKNTM